MTSLSNRCIIIGCTMVMQLHNLSFHGDLFLQGDQFIFNAVTDPETGEGKRLEGGDSRASYKTVYLGAGMQCFERRGMFVIPLASLTFSHQAFDCIKPALIDSTYTLHESSRRISLY